MNDVVLVAILSLIGNIGGSILSIMAASKLLNYRVDKIEEHLSKIDKIEDRVYNLEKENAVQNTRIGDIEKAVG